VRIISGDRTQFGVTVNYGTKNSNAVMHGIPDAFFVLKNEIPFTFGRRTNPLDVDQTRKVVALGTNVVERLFDKGVDPVGKDVRVKDVVMKVVGVFHDKMNRGQGSDAIYLPQSTYETVYGGGGRLDNIWIRPEPGVDGFELGEEDRRVGQAPPRRVARRQSRHWLLQHGRARQADQRPVHGINVFIWFVGLGTLMAGIVGHQQHHDHHGEERTREIGIRKALGATPFKIVSTLLLESTLVTAGRRLCGAGVWRRSAGAHSRSGCAAPGRRCRTS
jgi:putative ABC transport system permease protein